MRSYFDKVSRNRCIISVIAFVSLGAGDVVVFVEDGFQLSVFVLLLLCSIFGSMYALFYYGTKRYMRLITKYCMENHISMQELEADFAVSRKTDTQRRVGKRWIFTFDDHNEPIVKELVPLPLHDNGEEEEEQNELTRNPIEDRNTVESIGIGMRRMEELIGKYRESRGVGLTCFTILLAVCFWDTLQHTLNVGQFTYFLIWVLLGTIEMFAWAFENTLMKLESYCRNTGCSMNQLLQDFKYSKEVGKRVWLGREWIFYIDRQAFPNVVSRRGVSHMSYRRSILGGKLRLYGMDTLRAKIPMKKQDADKLRELL